VNIDENKNKKIKSKNIKNYRKQKPKKILKIKNRKIKEKLLVT
jgi:hypothetical protein